MRVVLVGVEVGLGVSVVMTMNTYQAFALAGAHTDDRLQNCWVKISTSSLY